MKACIVKPHYAGLFSLINNVITCMSLYDYVQVDWSEGCIYGNAWPALFRTNLDTPNPAYFDEGIDVINAYPHQALTYKNVGILYPANDLLRWREACHSLWTKLGVRREIYDRLADFGGLVGDGYTAVLIRGNVHAGEQTSGRAQDREDYARAIEKHQTPGKLYVASADTESLEWFRGRFDIVTHPDTRRSNSRDVEPHLTTRQTIEDAALCLLEVMIMAYAEKLIHPVSNMATAALYINPDLQSIYLP